MRLDSRDVTNIPARTRYMRELEREAATRQNVWRVVGIIIASIAVFLILGYAGYSDAVDAGLIQ